MSTATTAFLAPRARRTAAVKCGAKHPDPRRSHQTCDALLGYLPGRFAWVGALGRAPDHAKTITVLRCWRCKQWSLFREMPDSHPHLP